jgi:putative glutamine amidotransferase
MHPIEVAESSLAARLAGPGVHDVNSHHHQGIDRLGDGAVVTARATADDLPEALEWPDQKYVLGVQWHPEALSLQHSFTDLVAAATNVPERTT